MAILPPNPSKSCDTACSTNSSCFLQKRKPVHPLAASIRCSVSHTNSKNNTVKQRVLSAKLIKLRNLQSQINDASYHLQELQRENQTLRTLNFRQGKELTKIDGKAAELPRLIQNHNDDVRVLREKNKTLRKTIDELTRILKSRDDEILQMKKRLDELTKLNQNKHLGERKKLSEEIEDLKVKLLSAENEISTLNRRLLLEIKSSKQKLNNENVKHKECQRNLAQALAEIERLTGLVDVNCVNSKKKEVKLPLRKKMTSQSRSMITLDEKINIKPSEESFAHEYPNGFVEKLKPILTNITKSEESGFLDVNGDIISPTDSVKARLSAGKQRTSVEKITTDCEKLKNSTHKLERGNSTIDSKIQKSKENGLLQFNRTIGDYCSQVMNSVKNCNKVVENHQESLDQSKTNTEIIKDAVEEVKALDDQLKKNSIFSLDETELKKLLKPEKIEKRQKIRETNGHVDRKLREDPKAKLLATLRAIDKGEFIDNFDDTNNSTDKIYNSFTD